MQSSQTKHWKMSPIISLCHSKSNVYWTNALPILVSPWLFCVNRNDSAWRLLVSSSLKAILLLSEAALTPGSCCVSRSNRQTAWLLTTTTDMARRISPVTFPSSPALAPPALPADLAEASARETAKLRINS